MVFKEKPNFEPELGQILLSNTNYHSEEAYWAHEGLVLLEHVLHESKILEWENKSNYEGEVFSYRPYCWCFGDAEGHEEGCPDNFVHNPTGLVINWYKHNGRGLTSNQQEPSAIKWFDIVAECVDEVRNYEFIEDKPKQKKWDGNGYNYRD